jgi:hypothetical protein
MTSAVFLKIQELVSVTQHWGRDQQLGDYVSQHVYVVFM